jgi:hypothetical protein
MVWTCSKNEDRNPKVLNMKLQGRCPRGRSRWEQHLQKGRGEVGRKEGNKEGREGHKGN